MKIDDHLFFFLDVPSINILLCSCSCVPKDRLVTLLSEKAGDLYNL